MQIIIVFLYLVKKVFGHTIIQLIFLKIIEKFFVGSNPTFTVLSSGKKMEDNNNNLNFLPQSNNEQICIVQNQNLINMTLRQKETIFHILVNKV